MATLLIASTRPGAGKTAFTAWLASRMVDAGTRVGIAKAYGDAELAAANEETAAFRSLVPDAAVADPAPDGAAPSEVARIVSELGAQATLVEGLAASPDANRALAEQLDARVVLIADLDDPIAEAAAPYGDRLAGVVVNNLPRYKTHRLESEVIPAFEGAGITFLGAVPEDRRLVAVTVRTMCEHLDGSFTGWEEHSDELVDYVLIGANFLDWGVHYFSSRQNAAVLVRGDRPDIQMAALATPIKGMILTEGVAPLEYVHYEADQEEVPVAVVTAGTHDAAAALETLHERSRFDHPDKLTRFRELADDRIDFEALREALEQPVTG